MRTFSIFAIFLLLIPIIELYVFNRVADVIGVFPALLLIVFGVFVGVSVLRRQGAMTLYRAQQAMSAGRAPAGAMLEGLLQVIGGVLLVIPGFFTDTLSLIFLLPMSRHFLMRRLVSKVAVSSNISVQVENTKHSTPSTTQHSDTKRYDYEGEFVRKDEK